MAEPSVLILREIGSGTLYPVNITGLDPHEVIRLMERILVGRFAPYAIGTLMIWPNQRFAKLCDVISRPNVEDFDEASFFMQVSIPLRKELLAAWEFEADSEAKTMGARSRARVEVDAIRQRWFPGEGKPTRFSIMEDLL